MGKVNLTKSSQQLALLEEYFVTHKVPYKRSDIQEFGRRIGLSGQRVYKWLWDRRKIQKNKYKNKVKIQQDESFGKQEIPYQVVKFNKHKLKVPKNMWQVTQFQVSHTVSPWVLESLKVNGWQLVKYLHEKKENTQLQRTVVKPKQKECLQEQDPNHYDYNIIKTVKKPASVKNNNKGNSKITPKKSMKRPWNLISRWLMQRPSVKEEQIFYSD